MAEGYGAPDGPTDFVENHGTATVGIVVPGPPLPEDHQLAQPVRIDQLSPPWRLVVATDGLLSRLGGDYPDTGG